MSFSPLSFKWLYTLLLFSVIIACSQSLYLPSAETLHDTAHLNELLEGRQLYIKSCGGCHNLYRPEKYSDAHWTKEMDEMKVEAKITDQQAALILQYLTSAP